MGPRVAEGAGRYASAATGGAPLPRRTGYNQPVPSRSPWCRYAGFGGRVGFGQDPEAQALGERGMAGTSYEVWGWGGAGKEPREQDLRDRSTSTRLACSTPGCSWTREGWGCGIVR